MRDLKKGAVEMWFPSVYPEFIVVYPTSANQEIVEARNFCSEQESLVISKSHKKERRWRDQVHTDRQTNRPTD